MKSSFENILLALAMVLASMSLGSCIAKEEPNTECDIVEVILPAEILNRAPTIHNRDVQIRVRYNIDVTTLAPEFVLTAGATINPPSGTIRDFTTPQIYTVTSQDGQWSKDYIVSVTPPEMLTLHYGFENVRTISAREGKSLYDQFYETDASGRETMTWASANPAFVLTMQGTAPNTFPCYQADEGAMGKCAVLVTRSTGVWGAGLKKPIAAGNLFMGDFDSKVAPTRPLEATHFGLPFYQEPLSFSGVYKYTPGAEFCRLNAQGKLEPVPGETDRFSLNAILFETNEEVQWLNGATVDDPNNPNIIAEARFPAELNVPASEWTPFSVQFVFRPGKAIDPVKLAEGHYSMAVVMSSSAEGAYFCGAVGSTLMVDELLINCKKTGEEDENN